MASQTPPVIPPRPARSPHRQSPGPTSSPAVPKIPPRPSRNSERASSPLRDSYAPSPLNEPPNSFSMSHPVPSDPPHRPPSVTIPSLGQEGVEYEDLGIGNSPDNHNPSPAETRSIANDLKLHAPRPSLPSSSAKAQVQTVTRTDSRQAAAAGLDSALSSPHEEHERSGRLFQSENHSRADSSNASSSRRPLSQAGDGHGIPEIGQRVPMYPNAGDVQAPSQSPYPPENRAGHGVSPDDKLEKAWYEKHPDEHAKEKQGQYGPGVGTPRPDWALSSDDLNKIVRSSAVTGSGLGTSPAVTGTPEEEVGYLASDEYTNRLASPSAELRHDSQPQIESPLRKMSVPVSESENKQEAAEQEPEEQESKREPGVIHVDEPYHHLHHPDGFAPTPSFEAQSREPRDDGAADEPILAADEVRPESAYQHPAVSPTFDIKESAENEGRSRTPSASQSQSDSRSTSRHGGVPPTARQPSRDEVEETHTPLEDVAEYEPLFPEGDTQEKKPIPATERFKQRPEMSKHRFPSEDIWEDSPNSLQLHATVTTPDPPKEGAFEAPEQESARKEETEHAEPHEVASHIPESEDHEKTPSRPELTKRRFPSRDIWEDTPDSQQLVTAIEPAPPAQPAQNDIKAKSPDVPAKPIIPTRPQKRPQQAPPVDSSSKPSISPVEKPQPPAISDKPKPQIPIRPAKPVLSESSESVPKVTPPSQASGAEQTKGPKEPPAVPLNKPKPPVPARPGGSRIAALKAGFLSDLNSRLQVGPQGPKPPEKKEEKPPAPKGPLNDARKGRARGPARRKPAAEPATEPVASKPPAAPAIRITETWSIWQFNDNGELVVGGADMAKRDVATDVSLPSEKPMAPELAKNAAGEPVEPKLTTEKEEPTPVDKVESPEPEVGKQEPEPEPEPVVPSKAEDITTAAEEALPPIPSAAEEQKETAPSPITSPAEEKEAATSPVASPPEQKPEAEPAQDKMETVLTLTPSPGEEKPETSEAASATEPAAQPQPDIEEAFVVPESGTKFGAGAPPTAQLHENTKDSTTPVDEREHRPPV